MTNEEITKEANSMIDTTITVVLSVREVNHRPHIYMIGPKHITNSKGPYLEPDAAPCAMPGCCLKYEEHKSDKVMLFQLKRNCTNDEFNSEAMKVKDLMLQEKVDGIALVDTPEKFRIS